MNGGLPGAARHARSVTEVFDAVEASAWNEAARVDRIDLIELVGSVCSAQHGLRPLPTPTGRSTGRWGSEPGGRWRALGDLTAADRALLDFAEQFAVDVSAVTDSQRGALFDQWGKEAATLVAVTFVMDFLPRSRAALLVMEPNPAADPVPVGPVADGTGVWAALDGLIRIVPRLDALDPVTSELVRLHGARQHRCRLCRSLRSRPAVVAGADESFLRQLDDFEASDLSVHQKAALGMTDAMIWTPGRIDAAARRLMANASPSQCFELVADVTRNALNKIAVALDADAPHVEEGFEIYDIDADGELVYGLTLE